MYQVIIDEEETLFCPHLDIRTVLPVQVEHSPENTSGSISSPEESPCLESAGELRGENNSFVSDISAAQIESRKVKRRPNRTCSSCKVHGQFKKSIQLWRCLDSKCGLILCGAAGDNHAMEHFEDNPDHAVQENTNTSRLWCGICSREVFRDTRNRRRAPGVWIPPNNLDFSNDPPRGLCNIGNTCFMNAALQNIVAVAPLTSYLMGNTCNLAGKNVAGSYRWLLSELISEPQRTYRNGVMPSRLLHAVRASHPIFRGFQQHDAQEFLRLFMDSLANDTRVPHFILQEEETKKDDSENESDTESYETCDSGNGSEEALHVDGQNGDTVGISDTLRSIERSTVKVVLRSCLSDIFDGEIESSVQCLSCHQTSRRLEVFQDLSLPIPTRDELGALKYAERYEAEQDDVGDSGWMNWFWGWMKSFLWGPLPSLEDCFRAFFSSDELKGKNMYFCEKCGKLRNGIKRCSLYRLPEVLCIHLKRFRMYEYSGGLGYSGKICQYVQFPTDGLDVRPFIHPNCSDEVSEYRLTGVICHIGSVLGGHYTAFLRKGDHWFLADDSNIISVSWDTVAECEAYVLFYQKWGPDDDNTKNELIEAWTDVDIGRVPETRYHIVSRKWLTKLFWCEEGTPLDNSDVVCPHGFLVPCEDVSLRATWIPHIAWEMIIARYGGGPDLVHSGDCSLCTTAWKKFQKAAQKPSSGRKPSITESVHASFSSSSSSATSILNKNEDLDKRNESYKNFSNKRIEPVGTGALFNSSSSSANTSLNKPENFDNITDFYKQFSIHNNTSNKRNEPVVVAIGAQSNVAH